MSTRMEMNPVNRLFFLIKVLLITLNLVLLTICFLQNGLQKLELLFLMIIILLLLPELIPSKYFEKLTERLVFANGSQMKIKYELNNAHVCHDNVCFKIPSVLVKNMTDKVILGLPFINVLYHFLVEHNGITIDPFGQKVKFKFASKCQINIDYASKVFIQEPRMGSCQYFTNAFKGNTHSAKLLTINNDPNILNISLQELDNATWINTINK